MESSREATGSEVPPGSGGSLLVRIREQNKVQEPAKNDAVKSVSTHARDDSNQVSVRAGDGGSLVAKEVLLQKCLEKGRV